MVDGQELYYTDLLAQRQQLFDNVLLVQGYIEEATQQIWDIVGHNEQYVADLELVEQDIASTTSYQADLGVLLDDVQEEVRLRQLNPTGTGSAYEVRNIAGLSQTVTLGTLTDNRLGSLYLNLTALDSEVGQTLYSLQTERQSLQSLIVANQGQLLTCQQQLAVVQDYLALNDQVAEINYVLFNILAGMNDMSYRDLDTRFRSLTGYADVLSTAMNQFVTDLTTGEFATTTYGDLEDEYDYYTARIAQFQTVLDIVTLLVNMAQTGQIDYYIFDTQLRRLHDQYGEYVIADLWTQLEAINGHPTLPALDAQIASLNEKIVAMDHQFLEVAFAYIRTMDIPDGQSRAYHDLETILVAADTRLLELNPRYIPSYDNPTGTVLFQPNYARIQFNPDTVDPCNDAFVLTGFKGETYTVRWSYFDIVSGPNPVPLNGTVQNDRGYGPGGWTLYEAQEQIGKLSYEDLLALRQDLLYSWCKGDKDGIGKGEYTQIGNISWTYSNLREQGATGELDPELPTTRDECLSYIKQLDEALAKAQADRSALISHINATWQRIDGNPSLLEQEQIALQNEIKKLQTERGYVANDMDALSSILDEGQSLVGPEQEALYNRRDQLYGDINWYIISYDYITQDLQAMQVLESNLITQQEQLPIQRDNLIAQNGNYQATLAGYQAQLATLAEYELQMQAALEYNITQIIEPGRLSLYNTDLAGQQQQAEILTLAQNMVIKQGALAFNGLAESFRQTLALNETRMATLSSQFTSLQQNYLLLQQNLQARCTSPGRWTASGSPRTSSRAISCTRTR
jgi:hypothetical protein